MRVHTKVLQHVLNFFLQIDAHNAINAMISSAHAGVGRHVAARVGNLNICGNVSHGMLRSLNRSKDQFVQKLFAEQRLSC